MTSIHAPLINHFYTSFVGGDYKAMQACYHKEATFSDPVFPLLNKNEVCAMWHMLVDGNAGSGLSISFSNVHVADDHGECQWEAHYKLSLTNRQVHNVIQAKFTFRDGLIVHHHDQFDFYKWSRMAFGLKGIALGWSRTFKNKVQQSVQQRLTSFTANHPEYQASL